MTNSWVEAVRAALPVVRVVVIDGRPVRECHCETRPDATIVLPDGRLIGFDWHQIAHALLTGTPMVV